MALVSPGIQVTITDESQYLPSAVGTVPLVVIATAENKTINGLVAAGTTAANAGKAYGISSQRELANTFGVPTFRRSVNDTALHGDELNEYGLMAAYSALGLGNRAWVIRADIDLDQLEGSSVRPTGTVSSGTTWLDYDDTTWGIFEYDRTVEDGKVPFVARTPDYFITKSSELTGNSVPLASIGSVGDYAVVVYNNNNRVYRKSSTNTWDQVGSTAWASDIPVVTGSNSLTSTVSGNIVINGFSIAISSTSNIAAIASTIDAAKTSANIAKASATTTGRLAIYANVNANISGDSSLLTSLGIPAADYKKAELRYGSFSEVPAFKDNVNASGSVWVKTSGDGDGANFVYKSYNATTAVWNTKIAPLYKDAYFALVGLDSVGGGVNIPAGTTFVRYGSDTALGYKIYNQRVKGQTQVTGWAANPTFGTISDTKSFTISVSQPGTVTPITASVSFTGTTANVLVEKILETAIPNLTASLVSGYVKISHRSGGIITLTNTGANVNVISLAGFTSNTVGVVTDITDSAVTLTNWEAAADYYVSATSPTAAPADGTLWYYNDPTQIDILVSDSTGWKGYQNVNSDARGFDLSATDPNGVIISSTQPTKQSDLSNLVSGDLWLDSSDLEHFPRLYRYSATTNKWTLIDNTDNVSQNGIVFADARWGTSLSQDPVSDDLTNTVDLLTSNYTDPDCPDYRLFPRGTLLFNTRRSGYNVKKFVVGYFNSTAFPNAGIGNTPKNAWVAQLGYDDNDQPLMGHYSQRNEIVQAMKAAIDSNLEIREEGYNYNLLTAPGYPELIPNLVALNNDRANTGFVIGDTPINLKSTIAELSAYSNAMTTASPYLGIYYPSALTNDLNGNEIAVPPSHMMLRTFLYNDQVSYQWFAPAGTRRGLIDNARALGYVDYNTGNFVRNGLNNALRDAMYDTRMNPITLINGVGLVAYGQKTRSSSVAGGGSSLDRINVARLVNYLRTVLQGVANQFLFEPNDKIVRDQIKQLIESLMNDLIAKRGLYDYIVVCDETNNTSDRIARNELYVDIAVEPMKSVEFIYIPIRLKNPGTIAGTATTTETA